MRSTSNEFRANIDNLPAYLKCYVLLADGTQLTWDKSDFYISGNSFSEGSGSSSFPIGQAFGKTVTLSLINDDDRFADYDFYGAQIDVYYYMDLPSGSMEMAYVDRFVVNEPESYGACVTITATNYVFKGDIEYTSNIAFPASLYEILVDSTTTCGLNPYNGPTANMNVKIDTKPENLTHRELWGLVAMLCGGNAVVSKGNLKIQSWDVNMYKNPSFEPYVFGNSKSATIGTDDVIVTGIKTEIDGVEYSCGSSGYMIELSNQVFTTLNVQSWLDRIGEYLIGVKIRPFELSHTQCPFIEVGDICYIEDTKHNVYASAITDITYNFLGATEVKCSATPPLRNSSKYSSAEAKAIIEARKLVGNEKTARELALQELERKINTEAPTGGLFMTTITEPDNSVIYYMHNKQTLSESDIVWKLTAEAMGISLDGGRTYSYGLDVSGTAILNKIYAEGIDASYIKTGTLSVGGENNRRGEIYIYNAAGKVCGIINNSGIAIFSQETNTRVIINPDLGFRQTDSAGNDFYGLSYSVDVTLPKFVNPLYPDYAIVRTFIPVGYSHQFHAILESWDYATPPSSPYQLFFDWKGKFRYYYERLSIQPYWASSEPLETSVGVSRTTVQLPESFKGKNVELTLINGDVEDIENITIRDTLIRYTPAPATIYNKADGTVFRDTAYSASINSMLVTPSVGKDYAGVLFTAFGNMYDTALSYKGTPVSNPLVTPNPSEYAIKTIPDTLDSISQSAKIVDYDKDNAVVTIQGGVTAIALLGSNAMNLGINEYSKIKLIAVC